MTLSSDQIHAIVSENKYLLPEGSRFLSRCIDGRYENSENLPALAIPGADIGDLAVLYAAAAQYGFEIDHDKALQTLQGLTGNDHLSWHTDEREEKGVLESGCGHLKQLHLDPTSYGLQKEDVVQLDAQMKKTHKDGGDEVTLKGDHHEGAVLLIVGNYGVLPQNALVTESGTLQTQLFIFHKTFVDQRHKAWSKLLIEKKAVTLLDGLDEEYLYEALSSTTDDHLFETARRLAKDLPIFQVTFANDGSFEIEQQGFV